MMVMVVVDQNDALAQGKEAKMERKSRKEKG